MNKAVWASFLFPIVLIAGGPPKHEVSAEIWARSWVKSAIRSNKKKGIEFVIKSVKDPKGRFQSHQPEANPVLLVYSGSLEVITQNHAARDPGIDQLNANTPTSNKTLVDMRNFAKAKGGGWFYYASGENNGQSQRYKAYVDVGGDYLFTAIFRNPEQKN